jgi:hypothetical protein
VYGVAAVITTGETIFSLARGVAHDAERVASSATGAVGEVVDEAKKARRKPARKPAPTKQPARAS